MIIIKRKLYLKLLAYIIRSNKNGLRRKGYKVFQTRSLIVLRVTIIELLKLSQNIQLDVILIIY